MYLLEMEKKTRLKIKTGDMFGFWKVLKVLSYKEIICLCTGCNKTTKTMSSGYLRRTQSCGCKRGHFQKQTNLEKYGVEHIGELEEVKNKKRESLKKRPEYKTRKKRQIQSGSLWGHWRVLEVESRRKLECECTSCGKVSKVDYVQLLSGESRSCGCLQNRFRTKTNLEKYGVEHVGQLEIVKNKQKQTMLQKYGVEGAAQSTQIREKMAKTTFEKYGVEHYSQTPGHRYKLRDWNDANPGANSAFSTSKGELELMEWVQEFHPTAHKIRKEGNELDIFVPKLNIGIEYNGLYWHSEAQKEKRYHLNKTNFFKGKEIRTIHIFEHEWANRQDQVKSFLQSALGKNQNKIGARKCKFELVYDKKDIKEVQNFMEEYHIQGKTTGVKFVVKCLLDDKLIACATFGKHHRNSKDWVLSRFCTKTNYTIQGGLAKISKLAYKHLQTKIISWADCRLSLGNGYEKAGWKLESTLPPDYFYWAGGLKIVSKQSRQKKKVGTPKNMTEAEHAKLDGLERIWDCGKLRYIYGK